MTSSPHGAYVWGCIPARRDYNRADKGKQDREVEQTPKTARQFRLKAATRLHEAGIASNRRSATLR